MKTLKKFGVILLALAMLMSLATVALAAEPGPSEGSDGGDEGSTTPETPIDPDPADSGDVTITINPLVVDTDGDGTPETKVGHKYAAYQIFSGTQNYNELNEENKHDDQPLASIEWGEGVNGDALLAALQESQALRDNDGNFLFADCETAADVAEVLSGITDATQQNVFAALALQNATGVYVELESGVKKTVKIGYYVIKDITNLDGSYDAANAIILQLTTDIVIDPKYSIPTSEKKVQDVNDSVYGSGSWGDSADWDIGDKIPYQLIAHLTDENYGAYDSYYLQFVDTMSKGLTLFNEGDKPWKVEYTLNDKDYNDITEEFTLHTEEITESTDPAYVGGTLLTWTCENIKSNNGHIYMPIPAGATIVVSYKAELNENAQIGNPGNPNMSHIVFSNNPYVPTSHGETPDDKTVVYTFQFDVNKIDDHGNPLADAQFALYKLVPNDSKDPAYTEEQLKNLPESQKDTHHWVFVDDLENVTVENIVDHTKFFIKGLDDGTYRLVETEVPAGYNAAEDLIFTLTDDGHSLEDLGTLTVTPPVTVVDEDDVTGEIETDVINRQGITLPETGGIGTTIFYVVGGALVLAAIVLLITKKRMSKVD